MFTTNYFRAGLLASCSLGFVLILARTDSVGAGFDAFDLSLRIPAALSQFSPYADVAGIAGASAASKWASSTNPASADWLDIRGCLHAVVSPQYSDVQLAAGTTLHVTTQALTWDTRDWGTFLPSLAQASSNRAATRQGVFFEF
jgi:hypothetical protein